MENNAKQEILEAIHAFAEQVDTRFGQIDQRFGQIDQRLIGIDRQLKDHQEKFGGIDGRLRSIEARMVDKAYLDDKLADLRGDLIALTRKEDVKLCTLVDELVDQGSLSRRTADRILAMEPFVRR